VRIPASASYTGYTVQPHYTSPAGSNAILILSPCQKTRSSLAAMLGANWWTVHEATDQREAAALLDAIDIPVVIAAENWREFLAFSDTREHAPSVIVTAPFADEPLWAEVLNLGGYDVLAQPFDSNEVTRIVQAALRQASMPRFHRTHAALTSAAMGN